MYCIYNLKIKNEAGEKYGHAPETTAKDYVKDNSKWETGLFGATNGAEIKNLVVLNAEVVNTVIGQHMTNNDLSKNPGTDDEMATGILIGIAKNTTVSGCTVSGTITSASNNNGALVGDLFSASTVTNCYAQATVNTTGAKHHGMMFGQVTGSSKISKSGCSGTVTASKTLKNAYDCAGFLGKSGECTVTDCFALGVQNNGCSFIEDSWDPTKTVLKNCYTSVSGGGSKRSQREMNCTECFAVENQIEFNATDANTVSSFADSLGLNRETDPSKYSTTPMSVGTDTSGSQQGVSGSNNVTENVGTVDMSGSTSGGNIDRLNELISQIPDAENVTIADKDNIKEAKKLYENLNDAEYGAFPAESATKLNKAIDALCTLLIGDIVTRIDELPEADKLTAADVDTVFEIWDDYSMLSDFYKSTISDDAVDKLKAAYEKAEELANSSQIVVNTNQSKAEKIVFIVLAVLVGICVAATITMLILSVLLIHRRRNKEETDLSLDFPTTESEE